MIRLRTAFGEFGIGPTHPVTKGANPPRGANFYFSFWYAYKTNSGELLITYMLDKYPTLQYMITTWFNQVLAGH